MPIDQITDAPSSTRSPVVRRRGFRFALAGSLAVLGVGAALYLFDFGDNGVAATAPQGEVKQTAALELLPRDFAEATVQSLQRTIALTGTIYPLNQTEIKSQLVGQVVEVLVREGDQVSRGQILAKLDGADLNAKLNDKLGALAAGKAQLTLAEKNVENNVSLLERKFISQSAFDNVQSSYQVSRATLVSLQAQVEQARKALTDAVIRAPLEGVVSERLAQPGLVVAINTPLFTVQDLSLMNMEALVPTADIPQVKVGQQAELQVEGFSQKLFIGKVDRINPSAAKGSRSIVVHLRIASPDRRLRGGMFAQGNLAISAALSAIVVPETALRWQGEQASVMAIEDGRLVERPVVPGIRNESSGDIEITSGLAAGSRVVIGEMANLYSGQSVHIAVSDTERTL